MWGNTLGAEGATAPVNSQAQGTVSDIDALESGMPVPAEGITISGALRCKDRGGIAGQGSACPDGAGMFPARLGAWFVRP